MSTMQLLNQLLLALRRDGHSWHFGDKEGCVCRQ